MNPETTSNGPTNDSKALGELPLDELIGYGRELGLSLADETPRSELARLIRERQELLLALDADALLDVVAWSRRPVRRSASKEELAREIMQVQGGRYEELSNRGLVALARLRGLTARDSDDATTLVDRLKDQEGLMDRVRRGRRKALGWLMGRIVGGEPAKEAYQFLPEDGATARVGRSSLKDNIQHHGLVGGIAQRIRGAADDYIATKLDEIEARIDAKLGEIDQRLADWRDREIANRLKILKWTLIFTVVVAIISLGYNSIKSGVTQGSPTSSQVIPR
jgi:tetrahydromethanopterin S-methyltransferase subunit G